MRNDLTQMQEDLDRVLEDYFQIIPPFRDKFSTELMKSWDYDDFEKILTISFDDSWQMSNFVNPILDQPEWQTHLFPVGYNDGIDEDALTLTVRGNKGGLY